MKRVIYKLFGIVLLMSLIGFMPADVQAKTIKKSVTIDLSKKTSVIKKIPGASKVKKIKVKVKNKSIVSAKVRKSGKLTLKGKKAGKTYVTVTYKKNGKKKSYQYKVTVKKSKQTNESASGSDSSYDGNITLDAHGDYINVSWTKVSGADSYYLQRKEENGTWKKVRVTSSLEYKDKDVTLGKTYYYRVRAQFGIVYSGYSSEAKIKYVYTQDVVSTTTPEPVETVSPTEKVTPTETPVATPTVTPEIVPDPVYSYDVEVLNKFNIYEDSYVVVYVKTDNPDGETIGFYQYDDGKGKYSVLSQVVNYRDINYTDSTEDTYTTFNRKVEGGYVATFKVNLNGRDYGETPIELDEEYDTLNYKWTTAKVFYVDVKDSEDSINKWCDEVIAKVSADTYDEDNLGKWDDLDAWDKIERLRYYISDNYYYPRSNTDVDNYYGYKVYYVIQENVGAEWETGFADCGGSANMLVHLVNRLGYTAQRYTTTLQGDMHIVCQVTIGDEQKLYDATPYVGNYKDWSYLK